MDRLLIRVAEATTGEDKSINLRLSLDSGTTVEVNWGNGATAVSNTSGAVSLTCVYSEYGDYEITITQTDGTGGYTLGQGTSSTQVTDTNTAILKASVGVGHTTLPAYCFYACSALQSINIPSGITSIGNYCFYVCYGLQTINLPSGITSIGNYCFQNCYSLQTINLPSGITSIGSYCFQNCYSLQTINLPSGLTSLGGFCFQYCRSLQTINLPSGLTSLGSSCFQYCSSIMEILCGAETPPYAGNSTAVPASMPAAGRIYVPAASLEAYKTATYWSTLANRMVGY